MIKYEAKRDKCHRDENRNFLQELMRGLHIEKAEVESTEKENKQPLPEHSKKEAISQPVKSSKNANSLVVPELKISTPGGRTRRIPSSGIEKASVLLDNKENVPSRPESSASYTTHTVEEGSSGGGGGKEDIVKMWIRTTNRPRSNLRFRNDPVELYHKYQQDWEKFKKFIPGENDHSELRWKIRTKLLGS